MIRTLLARFRQGHRTIAYPNGPAPVMPQRFRGRPVIDPARCPADCRDCADACPTSAVQFEPERRIDLGRCLFCTDCAEACGPGAIAHDRGYRLAVRSRSELVVTAGGEDRGSRPTAAQDDGENTRLTRELDRRNRRLFGRALRLRQVSAGGCNGCEVDAAVLGTVIYDLGRFGIQFVASPRHADGLLITGPVTENMNLALRKTWEAVPGPRLVIASGACAISGGLFAGHPEAGLGASPIVPVDLFVPGCPPHPLTLLDGLLRLVGKLE